jgi:predicted dinucleotide-binding enzyme
VKIAIVGAGSIGGTLVRYLAAAGHEVSVANRRGPRALADLAAETGAVPTTLAEVARDAQVVIVSVPLQSITELRTAGLVLPHDAVVVDTSNYVPYLRDRRIEELDNGAVESQWTERHLGHPVVKAFNTIAAASLRNRAVPPGTPGRIALPVAGDDASARATVIELMDQIGFDGVDAGALDESWRQQPGTPVYLSDLDADGVAKALTEASPAQTEAWRARLAAAASG